ncbi:glycosyltransferase family 2 protein [Streptococcus sp. CF4-2]|jgi:group 2 glycosyl transferase|uniref:Putative glycosyl transferase n=1 Tax=Streptococcus infantis SPAR10 TaxID=1159208 RepID=J0YPG6_9STRE|nr:MULTISPECIES: glycosyltransferase family 2 protein [Streptococcus]SIA40200.1 glycosyltransferase, WcaA [Mycobacteroides abscessus subsp. abscessus]EJG89326.1 putative glycosyl transferase [Streptococcus infantis SPAR10]MCP9075070.1 glycosyltransferase family 2 protein [Streptococcus sp. CF4-3]MCP9088180.1 glycosyltransferase family 2 protein [Streptococcus sp. CF4-2]OFQ06619.1 glycosyltransferase [Streptococcus sp. HMSC062D07]
MKLSVVIPFYNEENMIQKMYDELVKEINQITKAEFEIIFINDGSKDRTFERMLAIAAGDSRVKYISFSRNFGKEAGTIAGLEYATGEAVILMDGDLQHPPAMLPQMIEAYEQGYDVVSARRTRTGEKRHRTFLAKHFYKLANKMMDIELMDGVSEFRLFSRKVVNAIISMQEYNRFSKGIFAWIGFNEKVIEYENQVRTVGETKYSLKFSLNYAIQGILSFNDKPLRMCINFGLFCLLISLVYVLWTFIQYLVVPDSLVSGYFTTIFSVVLFGGIQLISIGVLGEYIGKIYYEVKKRPHYLVDQTNITVKGEQNDD